MVITICGSMIFAKDMLDIKTQLEAKGIKVIIPIGTKEYLNGKLKKIAGEWGTIEGAKRKIRYNLIKRYYNEIKKSDAILVINKEKNGIKNYIGGNTFLEMGFAYVLGKPIYMLNPIPKNIPFFYQEIIAMQPVIIRGDLNQIKYE